MSQVTEEQLSAFHDGELPPEQLDLLLARIDRDPAHRGRLARYALISECLRSGEASVATLQLAERVRSKVLADSTAVAVPARAASAWRSWAAGGVAAAVAALALLVTGRQTPSFDAGDTPVAAVNDAPDSLSRVTVPASYRLSPRAAARLNGYLVAHGNYTNELSKSALDSHLVAARVERASWRQVQDPADVR